VRFAYPGYNREEKGAVRRLFSISVTLEQLKHL